MSKGSSERPITIYGAIAANLLIALAKFTAALFTGSSAMLAEGIHSVVDTGNEFLLLLGIHMSARPGDEQHPFGHGKEVYFWGLVVAIVLFGIGGGMSVYEGITHIFHPTEITDPTWNYAVLGIAFVAEGISWGIALKKFLQQKRADSLWKAFRASKDPSVFVVLSEDSAALVGILVAFAGVFAGHRMESPLPDAIASIVIGLVLAAVALILAYETKGLLVGESADPQVVQRIREIAEADAGVQRVQRLLTMHFGPDQILLNLDLEFAADLPTTRLPQVIRQVEESIRREFPQIQRIFIEVGPFAQPQARRSG